MESTILSQRERGHGIDDPLPEGEGTWNRRSSPRGRGDMESTILSQRERGR
jgi:hypothetical protein